MEVLCVGNSHMACVIVAAEEKGLSLEPVILKESRYFDGLARDVKYVPAEELPTWLSGQEIEGPVYSFIGGTMHLSKTYRLSPRPYDFVLPSEPDLRIEVDAEIIPLNALRASLEKSMADQLRALEALTRTAGGRIFHFEPPPPPSIAWWQNEREGVEPQAAFILRYKLWRLNSQIMRDAVEREGGVFVACPAGAQDDYGFLRPELCANSTHANAEYGALVLEQMASLV